jgi:hypothetical protein
MRSFKLLWSSHKQNVSDMACTLHQYLTATVQAVSYIATVHLSPTKTMKHALLA